MTLLDMRKWYLITILMMLFSTNAAALLLYAALISVFTLLISSLDCVEQMASFFRSKACIDLNKHSLAPEFKVERSVSTIPPRLKPVSPQPSPNGSRPFCLQGFSGHAHRVASSWPVFSHELVALCAVARRSRVASVPIRCAPLHPIGIIIPYCTETLFPAWLCMGKATR